MDRPGKVIEWRAVTGATFLIGDRVVRLEARTLVLRLPFGGLAWSRPSAVIVERNGKIERIAIHDVTRIVRALMLVVPLAASFVVVGSARSRRAGR